MIDLDVWLVRRAPGLWLGPDKKQYSMSFLNAGLFSKEEAEELAANPRYGKGKTPDTVFSMADALVKERGDHGVKGATVFAHLFFLISDGRGS